jgi:hypothetical protein
MGCSVSGPCDDGIARAQAVQGRPGAGGSDAPEPPRIAATLSQAERAEVDALAARAAAGDPVAAGRLGRLVEGYEAREAALLARDVYDAGEGIGAPPPGWQRASATPEILGQYGLNPRLLTGGDALGYRAELYLPSEALRAEGAKPVLAFRGTATGQDWEHNFRQGNGLKSEYYTRAMEAALRVSDVVGADGFEVAGHSLGGGLASAAAAVTGAKGTTFNAAGLHSATVDRFLNDFNRPPSDQAPNVTAWRVEGEVLTAAQETLLPAVRGNIIAGAAVASGAVVAADGALEVVEGAGEAISDGATWIGGTAPARWLGDRAQDLAETRVGRVARDGVARAGDFLDRRTEGVQQRIGDGIDRLQAVRERLDIEADRAWDGDYLRWAALAGPQAVGRRVDLDPYAEDGVTRRQSPLVGPDPNSGERAFEPVNRHLMPIVIGSLNAHLDRVAAGR